MNTDDGPIQLDKDIVYKKPEKRARKSAKLPWFYYAGVVGLVLVVVLLFINPNNREFIDSPPPTEQAERDSICSYSVRIEQYSVKFDSLPGQLDISLPNDFTYEKEDVLLWSIETVSGLYYSSDMDLETFGMGGL